MVYIADAGTILKVSAARNAYTCVVCASNISIGDTYYRDNPHPSEWRNGHRARHLCLACASAGKEPPPRGKRPRQRPWDGQFPYEPIGDAGDIYFSSHAVASDNVELLEVLFPDLWVPPSSQYIATIQHEAARIFDDVLKSGSLEPLSPRQFEELLAETLRREGFETWLTRRSGDGGRDVIACRPGHLPVLLIAEAKKMPLVDPLYVRSLAGVRERDSANMALLATTGRFSPATRAEAAVWRRTLQLKDGLEFLSWMRALATKK